MSCKHHETSAHTVSKNWQFGIAKCTLANWKNQNIVSTKGNTEDIYGFEPMGFGRSRFLKNVLTCWNINYGVNSTVKMDFLHHETITSNLYCMSVSPNQDIEDES